MYDETPALASWRMHPDFSPALEHRMTGHAAFAASTQALVAKMQEMRRLHPKFARMTRDSGHYVGAMLAVYLHCNGGLTMANLKAFCAWSGYLSPGRARAVLLYLQYLGFVEPIASLRQGNSAQWRVRPYLLEMWHTQMRLALEATILIEPAVQRVVDRFGEPGVAETFTIVHCQSLLAQMSADERIVNMRKHFLQRLGGTQVLHHIVAQATEGFPPSRPFILPVTELARAHSVTRMHIRRMVRDAIAAGMMSETEDGLTFSEPARAEIAFLFGAQLGCLLNAAAATEEQPAATALAGMPIAATAVVAMA